ncbi:MAG: anion permease [Deltaproteobacteria bacterium]|nr:anion permease [Deltaproteobacteria bacterium]
MTFARAAGPVLFVLIYALAPLDPRAAAAAGGAAWMAVWWVTEAVPMAVTALLPLALWPLFDVHGRGFGGSLVKTAGVFLDAYLFLFLGGMLLGAGMEATGLHRRIALGVLAGVGGTPHRVLFGVLLATALVSMWISNTATAVMMAPIAGALVGRLEDAAGRRLWGFGTAVMLAVCYGANLGGIGTKIGSGTNSIFAGFVEDRLGIAVSFPTYMLWCLPFVVLLLPIVFLALARLLAEDRAWVREVPVAEELARLGPMTSLERRAAAAFAFAAVLWVFGDPLRRLVAPHVPAFWDGFSMSGKHWEAWVAMTCAATLFPARVLGPGAFRTLHWASLALLGGSFAMAGGIEGSGLSGVIASGLIGVASMPLVAQTLLAAGASVLLSAVASNTATVNVLLTVLPRSLPVLAASGIGASCDFALPAGTPPNAIVFGSGRVRLPDMVRTGVGLDVAAALLLGVYAATWIAWWAP